MGTVDQVRIQTVIQRQFKRSIQGRSLAARVNAAIAANIGEDDSLVSVAANANADDDGIVQTARRRPAPSA